MVRARKWTASDRLQADDDKIAVDEATSNGPAANNGAVSGGTADAPVGRILIADDHPLFRGALRQALPDVTVEEAGDMSATVAALEADEKRVEADDGDPIDLVLLDLAMPGESGLAGLVALRGRFPQVAVVVVSATDDATTVRRLMQLGASGFVSKSSSIDAIREAVSTVMAGGMWFPAVSGTEDDPEVADLLDAIATLTPQQSRVLAMLTRGLLNKQIAWELSVSEATVKAHVSAVLQKLGVDSRTQAVIKAGRVGLG